MFNVFPLFKNVLKPLAKSVLIALGSTGAALATDAATQKNVFCIRHDYTNKLKWRNVWHHKNSLIFWRTQAYNLLMCGYLRIGFIDFILKGKSFLDYTSLFFSNEYEQNSYFK